MEIAKDFFEETFTPAEYRVQPEMANYQVMSLS